MLGGDPGQGGRVERPGVGQDAAGTRPSVLAARAGMTKATLGELVDQLERLGYVTRQTDPADRRAKLVRPTPRVREVTALVQQVNDAIERRLQADLGEATYAALRQALLTLVPRSRQRIQPRIPPPRPRD